MNSQGNQVENINQFLSGCSGSDFSILGNLGTLYFKIVSSYYLEDKVIYESSTDTLENILTSVDLQSLNQFYCDGFISLGLLLKLLNHDNVLHIYRYEEIINFIDALGFDACNRLIENKNFDFFYGATGVLHYFLKDINLNNDLTSLFSAYIDNLIEYDFYCVLQNSSKGIDLGLPHGLLSILIILRRIYIIKFQCSIVRKQMYRIINLYYSTARFNSEFIFPTKIIQISEQTFGSRLAWCYGDLIAGYVLLETSEFLKDIKLKSFSLNIIRKCCNRKLFNSGVVDPFLCHGSEGIAVIYDKLFDLTGKHEYLQQSFYWQEQTKKLLSLVQVNNRSCGLLEGVSGIGLSSFSRNMKLNIDWKYILMLN